ncbi:MAG: phosphoserine phosphatase SerB [Acidobacteriaceae bacterium]
MTSEASPAAILIHFSGTDRPGITAAITHVLAAHGVVVLDIGQSVVHESLSLGILIEVPTEESYAVLKVDLTGDATRLGLHATFTGITADALKRWLHGARDQQFIVTMLGRRITAAQLSRVSSILAEHQMNVSRIERLSHELSPKSNGENACVELAASGDLSREAPMRADFMAAAEELSIDIAFQHESIYRRNRRLFAFDMDSTLIQGEVIDQLAAMAGVGEEVSRITEGAMRGDFGFDESFTRRVGLLKGLPAEKVYSLLDKIPLTPGAERLLRTLRLLGYKTAILSGGFNFFARNLQQRLGIDYVHSNELEIIDGKVSGRVIPPIVNGERKAALLQEIAHKEGISLEQVVAVGDGANDIPMISLAGMGIAYHAKPRVRRQADHSIANLGLDGLLYLIGVRDRDLLQHESTAASRTQA